MSERVTIGVPVYKGEAFVADALRSIQAQTHADWQAIVSFDVPDARCEAVCRPFLSDPRFRLVVQPERLGWVGQLNWLMSQVSGDFWYFHQQDDLTEPTYLEVLVDHARCHPEAALVYCDVVPFGRIEGKFEQVPSVTGATPFTRQMTLLREHFKAYAFRGLTRAEAVRRAGPVPTNDRDNFGVDIAWIAGVALAGELHHAPAELYRKHYHGANTESGWWNWDRADRLAAWPMHCTDMLNQALRVQTTVPEARLLWLAAVERLTSQVAASFLPVADLTDAEREGLLVEFLEHVRDSRLHEVPCLLDADWTEIERLSRSIFDEARAAIIEIQAYGPTAVPTATPFNVQPDGRSALWVKTSRSAFPEVVISLAGRRLETHRAGSLFTAFVPDDLTAKPGSLELVLIGRDGMPRSAAVTVQVE